MCKMGIPKEVVIIATTHENTKMIDEVYLHVSSHDKAHKLSEAIIEKTQGSMFVAHKEQVSPQAGGRCIQLIFADDLLLELAKKYEATKVHEVLDKDLDKGFLELPTTKQAIAILKATNRINEVDINKYRENEELKHKVKAISIIGERGKVANDVLLIQFFQDNVITLGLNTEYYLPATMSKREIQRLFKMKLYKDTIIA